MLISRRKEGETLLIGDDIEVRIIAIRGKKVTLGVVAPRELRIASGKLTVAALANTMAAAHSASFDLLAQAREGEGEKPVVLLRRFPAESGESDR